jgi:hypothetical protein
VGRRHGRRVGGLARVREPEAEVTAELTVT